MVTQVTQVRQDGRKAAIIDEMMLSQMQGVFRGAVLTPNDPVYEKGRQLYNGMIDKHPALIVQCSNVGDVITAVNFARTNDLEVAIRSGGHNGAGLGSVENGLVIDLSAMKGIRVDPASCTVRVQAGCTWGDVDHATHAFGLALPSGIISTTGVGGLTLGGGHGHLSRKYGLTIDNLLEADVVLADGTFVTANQEQSPDLFWAIRGGGGNFGVITSFLFQAHPVHTIVGGPTLWELNQAKEVMQWYREFILNAPEELNGFFAFLTVPPAPPFPAELHGKKMCGIIWCYCGPEGEAEAVFEPVTKIGPPALHGIHPMPYPVLQGAFDGLYPPGLQWYWRGDFVKELSDEAIERHVAHAEKMPTMHSTMHLYPIDGAVHRVDRNETAFNYRDSNWSEVIVGVDPDPALAGAIKQWTLDYWDALHPYSAGGAYVNFMMQEGRERVRATYRDNYERLARIKARYDPNNFFHVNQNIRPGR